jgi:hypothetical protein
MFHGFAGEEYDREIDENADGYGHAEASTAEAAFHFETGSGVEVCVINRVNSLARAPHPDVDCSCGTCDGECLEWEETRSASRYQTRLD